MRQANDLQSKLCGRLAIIESPISDIEKRRLMHDEAMLELKRDEGWFPSAASSVIADLERIDCIT